MFQNVKKGDIVKTFVREEPAWVTVTGDHNNEGLQVRLETPLDNAAFKVGQFFRIAREDVFDVLPKDSIDDD